MDQTTSQLHEQAKQGQESANLMNFVGEGARSALYSAVQSPLDGLSQMVDVALDTSIMPTVQLIDAPAPSEFGSARWHAQQIGGAVGMVLPFMVAAKATRAAFAQTGLKTRSAAGSILLSKSCGTAVAEGAISGGLYEFFVRTSDQTHGHSFWMSRLKHGVVGALTFGTLTAGTVGIRSLIPTIPGFEAMARTGAEVVVNSGKNAARNMGTSAVAGLAAGLVSAESESLLSKGHAASAKELVASGYAMLVAGGALGALHSFGGKPEWRPREIKLKAHEAEATTTDVEHPANSILATDILTTKMKGHIEGLNSAIEPLRAEKEESNNIIRNALGRIEAAVAAGKSTAVGMSLTPGRDYQCASLKPKHLTGIAKQMHTLFKDFAPRVECVGDPKQGADLVLRWRDSDNLMDGVSRLGRGFALERASIAAAINANKVHVILENLSETARKQWAAGESYAIVMRLKHGDFDQPAGVRDRLQADWLTNPVAKSVYEVLEKNNYKPTLEYQQELGDAVSGRLRIDSWFDMVVRW